MKTIRKSEAKPQGDFESAVLNLPNGAHLKAKDVKLFGPKFAKAKKDQDNLNVEETFWVPNIQVRFVVVDDRTEDGDADGAEFTDKFELKLDTKLLEESGFDESRLKGGPVRSSFTEEEQEMLLDPDNWTIRDDTKLDRYNTVVFGKPWIDGTLDFHEDLIVDTEVIAKVLPRTGKRPGSYCEWNTFMSVHPPKKQRKLRTAQQKAAEAANNAETAESPELTLEEEAQMKAALGDDS